MNNFLMYSLQTIVLQLVFLLIFEIFFKKETFFKANRFYLLGSMLLSFLIPLIKIPVAENVQKQTIFQLKEIVVSNVAFVENKPEITTSFSWISILYLLGIVVFLTLFLLKLYKIYQVKQNSLLEIIDTVEVHRIKNSNQAFSFFNAIFIGNDNTNIETILKHEKVHAKQLHSLDLLFLEVLKIIFWFNPIVYFFQKRIVEIHEFEADSTSVIENKSNYYETLICQIFEVNSISLTNNFYNQSLIKKRLVMLQKSKSKKAGMMKYLVVIPMVVFSMVVFSTKAMAQEKAKTTNQVKKETLIKQIKEFNASVPKEEKIKVIDKEFIEEIVQDIDEKNQKQYLEKNIDTNDPIPFATLENVPAFKGCENKTASETKECFIKAMNNHIATHFTYPKEALVKDIQGRVTILFVINKEGNVEDLRVKGTGKEGSEFLENEATRIMKLLPKFKPAMLEGKPISVSYAQPINFKIQEDEKLKPIEIKE